MERDRLHMIEKYQMMQAKGFQANAHNIAFLTYVYGEDSRIVQNVLDAQAQARHKKGRRSVSEDEEDSDDSDDKKCSEDVRHDGVEAAVLSPSKQAALKLQKVQRAHDHYWKVAQRLLVKTESW